MTGVWREDTQQATSPPERNTFPTPLWITMVVIWLLMLAAIVTLGLGLAIWNLIEAF